MEIICDCKSNKVEVMSAIKKAVEIDKKDVNIVEINFICNNCGKGYTITSYLYEN